jgi:mRNA interferase RelE/StbE
MVTGKQYRVEWTKQATRDMGKIRNEKVRRQIMERVSELAENPRPRGSMLLKGKKDLRRVRVGGWRIVYTVIDGELRVVVIYIGDRKDIYRKIA